MLREPFKLGEEIALRRNAVDDADRVIDVVRHGQMVAGVLDGTHVARRNVAGGTDEGEIFHVGFEGKIYRRKTVKPASAACSRL